MDPLTAAGLVGHIINFVNFSTKVLSRARQLHESGSGAMEENDELESQARNIKDLADRTRHRPSAVPGKSHSSLSITSEKVLDGLSQQCIQVADELLEILNSVKVKGDNRTRKSAIQAVKTMWKQDQIVSLQRRLDRINKQLIDAMSMDQLDEINRRLREMAVENTRLEVNRSQDIDQLRKDFNSAIEDIKAHQEDLADAWLVLSDAAHRGQAYFAEQVILQSLRFSSIDARHESISKEHSQTFSWIFDDASVNFVKWLENEDGVYWVSGKPGSGKSTLMKFVAAHEKTQAYLDGWAGDKKLVIAKFYFWNASAQRSQKSQRGLLRAILYQILRQCPELIQVAYRDQWIAMTSDGKVLRETRDELLSVPALLNTLRNISTATASDTKFCFFVDGLDEYEGRPADIIDLVDILRSFQNVKTCVSSRPWNEFEDHFGKDTRWKLYIHEHTINDIRLYVEDTLGKNERFQQLRKDDPQCPNFVSNIVREADGVFLWVFLVTRSLLDGLTNSDRIKDLQQRMNETPKDLQDYFKTILFSTENRYRTQTARIFTIAVNPVSDLPLMAYWVIDQEDTNYMFQLPVETPPESVLLSRLENMERRLKALSKGLLETRGKVDAIDITDFEPWMYDDLLFAFKVDFLHRTVKDYLQTPDARLLLQTWTNENFNPDLEICAAYGALAKMAPPTSFGPKRKIWGNPVFGFFLFALRLDQNLSCSAEIADIIDDLEKAIVPAIRFNKERLNEWLVRFSKILLTAKPHKDYLDPDLYIISACIGFGLSNYVAKKFTREPQLCQRVANNFPSLLWSTSILQQEILDKLGFLVADSDFSEVAMLVLLLMSGVDPNSSFGGQSEWRLYLELLMAEAEESERQQAFDSIKLMLRHGANFKQHCTALGRETTADELLKEWFDADQFGVLQDIVKRRDKKQKKGQKISKKLRHLQLWIKSKK